jgi:hypothetical protein
MVKRAVSSWKTYVSKSDNISTATSWEICQKTASMDNTINLPSAGQKVLNSLKTSTRLPVSGRTEAMLHTDYLHLGALIEPSAQILVPRTNPFCLSATSDNRIARLLCPRS